MFFHTFTEADSTCAFYRLSKPAWYSKLMSFPMKDEIIEAFIALSWRPSEEAVKSASTIIEDFVSFAYGKKVCDLDVLRFTLFTSKTSSNFRELPPTKDALSLHISRSAFQAGWLRGNTLSEEVLPSVEEWGWLIDAGELHVRWVTDNQSNLGLLIDTCKCRTTACKSCKCAKKKIKCLSFCGCKRQCEGK